MTASEFGREGFFWGSCRCPYDDSGVSAVAWITGWRRAWKECYARAAEARDERAMDILLDFHYQCGHFAPGRSWAQSIIDNPFLP